MDPVLRSACDTKYRGTLATQPWTLCVGAGICIGIVPNWFELTRLVVNKVFNTKLNSNEFKESVDQFGWSLDSWIQAACNNHILKGHTQKEFEVILEDAIYSEILLNAKKEGLEKALRTALNNPRRLKGKEANDLVLFFEKKFGKTSVVRLAKVLARLPIEKLPKSIITFNAEVLLHTLIELYSFKFNGEKVGRTEWPPMIYDRVLRSPREAVGPVPILHIHGCITPEYSTETPRKIGSLKPERDARDKLIFLESAYNDGAGSMFSWAQSTFLFYAQYTKMVFVGMSMSDPNIRRWLSWSAKSRLSETRQLIPERNFIYDHLWIHSRPESEQSESFLKHALSHLAIRPYVIDGWSELTSGLENLLSIKSK